MRLLLGIDLRLEDHRWLVERAGVYAAALRGQLHLVYVDSAGTADASHQKRLDQLLERLPAHCRGVGRVEVGGVADTLVRLTPDYDVLVVGSREPVVLERMLFGPMATRVLREAKCPVLVPRGGAGPGASPRILVGADLESPTSSSVLRIAGAWAQWLDGKVDAVYSVNQRVPHIAEQRIREQAEREWQKSQAPAQAKLEALLEDQVRPGQRGQALVTRGEPDDVLIAMSQQADFVIVGNRPRTGLSGLLLGPVSQSVVRRAHCDVLSLPTASHGE